MAIFNSYFDITRGYINHTLAAYIFPEAELLRVAICPSRLMGTQQPATGSTLNIWIIMMISRIIEPL